MPVTRCPIEGLLVVSWPTHDDPRGFFRQTYQVAELAEALGREVVLRQGNHSRSAPGVLRGFHAEPLDKLVYVPHGAALQAVADIRPGSPTFGQVATFRLGDAPGCEPVRVFIAEGLANAFCALGHGPTDYLYDASGYWQPGTDKRAVAWDDPDLGVAWPMTDPLLSDADRANPSLRALFPDHPRWADGSPRV